VVGAPGASTMLSGDPEEDWLWSVKCREFRSLNLPAQDGVLCTSIDGKGFRRLGDDEMCQYAILTLHFLTDFSSRQHRETVDDFGICGSISLDGG